MENIRLQRQLKIPAGLAFQASYEILQAIAAQEGAWRGFALHARLGDLHLPDVGYVSVPIALAIGVPHPNATAIEIQFGAAKHGGSFPTYRGSIGVDATDSASSILWLDGNYDVPFKLLGKAIDATAAGGVAARTLENFIDDLATASIARVEKREADFMRYRNYGAPQ